MDFKIVSSMVESDDIFTDIYSMDKDTSEIVSVIGNYLKEVVGSNLAPEKISDSISSLLIERNLANDQFSIEVIPLKDRYILRSRNLYSSQIIGSMPSFCNICGKPKGKDPCSHEQ